MKFLTPFLNLFRRTSATPAAPAVPHAQPQIQDLLAAVLREQGFEVVEKNGVLTLESGIDLRVQLLDVVDLDHGNVRTSTSITAFHAALFPEGLPEFQHNAGISPERSVMDGFANWVKMDLVTLQDLIRSSCEDCTCMEMSLPPRDGDGPRARRVILGPTGHFASGDAVIEDEEHPFCPCCLFTQSIAAFGPVLESDATFGIRLFASRDGSGVISADCRINGKDFPEGVEHLIQYAKSWPARPGIEFRKQYVAVRSI